MLKKDEIFIDKNSYNDVWNIIISPTIRDYQNRFAEITVAHNAQEIIWEEYTKFNLHCKTTYMQDASGKLDRHKVCACYMFAIVKAGVLGCRLADSDTERSYLALNENLAITVGMSLLRAFVLSSIKSSEELPDNVKEIYRNRIDDGIVFPECNHGVYRENFVSELHYTNDERNYNVLSLANTLFLLEIHTLQTEVVHRQGTGTIKKKKVKGKKKQSQ